MTVPRLAFAVTALSLLATVSACGSSSPRAAIERAVRADRAASPRLKRLTFLKLHVSAIDRRFSVATTHYTTTDGLSGRERWLLRRRRAGWHVIFVGPDAPPCKVPQGVRRELFDTTICYMIPHKLVEHG